MNLDRARQLKQDLVAEAAGRAGLRRRALWKGGFPGRQAPPVALGIEGRDGDYRLAIRVQRGVPGVERVVEDLVRAAGNEAGVRQVGYVVPQGGPFGRRRGLTRRYLEQRRLEGSHGQPANDEVWAPARPFGACHSEGPDLGAEGDGGPRQRHRPLVAGLSVGGPDGAGGTLGLLVEEARGSGPRRRGFLTSAHGVSGTEVLQPAGDDGGRSPEDRVARLVRGFLPGPRARNRVDVSFVELVGEPAGPGGADARALPGLGRFNGVRRQPLHTGLTVFKVGRGSGVTRGRVDAFELDDLVVSYRGGIGDAVFDGQFEIVCREGDPPFSRRGDSGSLVVDEALRGVGLLFAGNGVDASFAHPLPYVLDQLRVQPV